MNDANFITLSAFLLFILLGLAIQTLVNILRQRPSRRVAERFKSTLEGSTSDPSRKQMMADLQRAQADARRRRRRQKMGTLGYYLNRLDTVSGGKGTGILVGVGLATLLLLGVGFLTNLLPSSLFIVAPSLIAGPLFAMSVAYRHLLHRFRSRFLNQLPEAIDLIARASQAGVPVAQSIRTAGDRFEAPLGPEFRRMGDSLLLGNDMAEVLDDASLRIELPDFSFLAVCLLLQRETGGSLAETLENLSSIIRARRDIGLKAKALTAEGRFSAAILSALPFLVGGVLMLASPDYLNGMIEHPTGRKMLWAAAGMLTIGLLLIRKISRIEV